MSFLPVPSLILQVLWSHPYSLPALLYVIFLEIYCSSFVRIFLENCRVQSILFEVWIILCLLKRLLSIHLSLWFVHYYITKSSPTCWNILLSSICWWLLQLKVMVFCLLLLLDSVSCSLVPIIVICPSLECRNIVLYILTWIPLLI